MAEHDTRKPINHFLNLYTQNYIFKKIYLIYPTPPSFPCRSFRILTIYLFILSVAVSDSASVSLSLCLCLCLCLCLSLSLSLSLPPFPLSFVLYIIYILSTTTPTTLLPPGQSSVVHRHLFVSIYTPSFRPSSAPPPVPPPPPPDLIRLFVFPKVAHVRGRAGIDFHQNFRTHQAQRAPRRFTAPLRRATCQAPGYR